MSIHASKTPRTLYQLTPKPVGGRKGARLIVCSKNGDEVAANPSTQSKLSSLVDKLLMNAASIRTTRGTATCQSCKGTGALECTACKGSGIVAPEKIRMNSIKHAVHKLESLIPGNNANSALHDGDWVKTNRCKRCHGTGVVICPACNGLGVRKP